MARYFGVITGRDYIDIHGERIPFWHLLDKQPRGWLTSIANIKKDIPKSEVSIYDCGAWTYRDSDIPALKNALVTPEWAYDQYKKHCSPGDMLIAPDHMLIGVYDNLDSRRKFNRESLSEFISLVDSTYKPMAVLHGLDSKERIDNLNYALDAGYTHVCLGGLAGQARRMNWCVNQVEDILARIPAGIWVHVLGLSSPFFAAAWKELGVSSFDGSSYFKKAFNGDFVTSNNGDLGSIRARRQGEAEPVNTCNCGACAIARDSGFNTMMYGNSVNNIGRAAHNLNMLIQKYIDIGVMQ